MTLFFLPGIAGILASPIRLAECADVCAGGGPTGRGAGEQEDGEGEEEGTLRHVLSFLERGRLKHASTSTNRGGSDCWIDRGLPCLYLARTPGETVHRISERLGCRRAPVI